MFARMKKILKKEKGFTLVELLAVIVILGIILAIAIPAVGNVISKSENDAKQANIDLILNAARLADVNGEFSDDMKVSELKDEGYLEEIPEVPGEEEETYGEGTVKKNEDGTFEYTSDIGKPSED
ncbi:prepilin-type N-terminal cleavage/methylation domain-containing protein [Lentibacillus sp. Marseille-P4043]|uniref:prepilin-type N-terminal cleavage/methylation domain-containing protein n=1 Tax=Lentibacillus sp. Marseille-P4043 TaxID=2040293 RepID=UPI000D0B80AD|nr:prepilin-type N-terminal cleavage/methylation domain-containing protein [Lentibacillus sp. Marseille-P4043]